MCAKQDVLQPCPVGAAVLSCQCMLAAAERCHCSAGLRLSCANWALEEFKHARSESSLLPQHFSSPAFGPDVMSLQDSVSGLQHVYAPAAVSHLSAAERQPGLITVNGESTAPFPRASGKHCMQGISWVEASRSIDPNMLTVLAAAALVLVGAQQGCDGLRRDILCWHLFCHCQAGQL